MDRIEFKSAGADWGTVTHMGIFRRRPWWQRALSVVVRRWKSDVCIAAGAVENMKDGG